MELSSSRTVNSLLFCSIVSSLLHLLDLLVCLSPRHFHLSRFDEPTQPAVTMTESHTRCASRGKIDLVGHLPTAHPQIPQDSSDRELSNVIDTVQRESAEVRSLKQNRNLL